MKINLSKKKRMLISSSSFFSKRGFSVKITKILLSQKCNEDYFFQWVISYFMNVFRGIFKQGKKVKRVHINKTI